MFPSRRTATHINNPAQGTITPVQPQQQTPFLMYDTDYTQMWRFATVGVVVIGALAAAWWVFDHDGYTNCKTPLCLANATATISRAHNVTIDRETGDVTLERAPGIGSVLAPREHVRASRNDRGVATLDGPGRCDMHGGHEGERGYVWADKRCHHLPPSTATSL